MIFTLTIELEDDVTRPDVALALRRVAGGLERLDKSTFEDGDSGPIRNPRGGIIGDWEVSEE